MSAYLKCATSQFLEVIFLYVLVIFVVLRDCRRLAEL